MPSVLFSIYIPGFVFVWLIMMSLYTIKESDSHQRRAQFLSHTEKVIETVASLLRSEWLKSITIISKHFSRAGQEQTAYVRS